MQLGHTNMPHGCHTSVFHVGHGHTLASGSKFMVGMANVNMADKVSTRTKSDFVFKIAHLLGFPWDHCGLFATLSSRLVNLKFRDIITILCQPGHNRDRGLN